jgi:hypothetical protein
MKKFKFKIGDLVACYNDPDNFKIILGWVVDRWKNKKGENNYHVHWSDIADNPDYIQSPIDEYGMNECYNLLQKAIETDTWSGKKIL